MMTIRAKKLPAFMLMGTILLSAGALAAQTIRMEQLSSAPVLDGSDSDWTGVDPVVIPLKKSGPKVTVGVRELQVRGGVFGDEVFFFLQWEDATRDERHKPFVWDTALKKYVKGKEREDRLAIQFAMEGDFTVDWLSGKSFEADMWHWKAARSNPLGLVHDKMTIIGRERVKKAFKARIPSGETIYIQRPSDAGDKMYSTRRYSVKEKDVMPKYILTESPRGSVADIKCRGVWKDGKWRLEIRRKLDTGHDDDVVFAPGTLIRGGFAVFDHSGDDDHVISETLTFQF